jgi:hypothetical protein
VPITIVVHDNGSPVMPDLVTINITVLEVNTPPVVATIADKNVAEGSPLSFNVAATDSDLPANQLTYSLQAGAPAGAAVDPITGLFTWTPDELHGPGVFDITVMATDDGTPNLSGTRTFRVNVAEVNVAPVLGGLPNQMVVQNQLLLFQVIASDADLPANVLTFSLDAGAPSGSQIDASTGIFLWTPTHTVAPGDYPITVRVTDNGSPALSDSQTVIITVLPQPTIDGDFNNDGLYNVLDIDDLVAEIASGMNNPSYDLTADGLVDLADRDAWLTEAGGVNLGSGRVYRIGDGNLDGVVDGSDFNLWNSNKFTLVAAWSRGDFNADGAVDGSDFNLWNGNKFTSS